MANLMHRLLRSKSCFSPIQRLTPSLIKQKEPCISNIGSIFEKSEPVSFVNPVISLFGNESDQSMRFYPSFSVGYFMNPSMIQCPDLGEIAPLAEKEEKKEEVVIYADSVKKKRKKKMNKHKYRKLRKRIRKKS